MLSHDEEFDILMDRALNGRKKAREKALAFKAKVLEERAKESKMPKKSKKEIKEAEEIERLAKHAEEMQKKAEIRMREMLSSTGPSLSDKLKELEEYEKSQKSGITEKPKKNKKEKKVEEVEEIIKVEKPPKEHKHKKEKEIVHVEEPKIKEKRKQVIEEKESPKKINIYNAKAYIVTDKKIHIETKINHHLQPKEKKLLKAAVHKSLEDHLKGKGIYVNMDGNYITSLYSTADHKYNYQKESDEMKMLIKETTPKRSPSIKSGVIDSRGRGLRSHIKTHMTPNGKLLVFDTSSDEGSSSDSDEERIAGMGYKIARKRGRPKGGAFEKPYH